MGPQYRNASLNLFKEVAEVNPSNPCMTPVQVLFYIAEYQSNCNKYIDAMRTYQKLYRINPDNPYVFVKLIDVFLKSDNKDLASDVLKVAKKVNIIKKTISNP